MARDINRSGEYAIEEANRLHVPLVAWFSLIAGYPAATLQPKKRRQPAKFVVPVRKGESIRKDPTRRPPRAVSPLDLKPIEWSR